MADIRLAKPAAGATQTVPCEPEARFVFDFPTTDATLARDGDNLNIRFEDGSNLQLEGFYQQYNEENLPSFNIDGTEVAAADFFQAMNEPDLMPAAGPGTGTVANGARFHEWGDSALTGGIQHLDGLDWGFSRSFEWDDVPNAVGRNGDDWGWWSNRGGAPDNPVSIVPEDPTPVPPGTPDIPGVPVGGEPGNQGIVPPGDVRVVDEAGLRDGDSVSVNGAMRITAPDGLAGIEIAGQAIWQNGHILGNPSFATDEGYFHNFAYDASSGRLTYTYTLTSATQEHGQPGADHIAHSLPVTVRDTDGDSASSSITIVIRDDVAEAVNDYGHAVEGQEISWNVLYNDKHGADGEGLFAGEKKVRWELPAGTREDVDENGRAWHEFDVKDGDTTYGTVRLYDDGSYTFKAASIGKGGWDVGVTKFSRAIGYDIVDADGDIAHATLNLETLKTPPSITPNTPQPGGNDHKADAQGNRILVDEGDLPGGSHAHDEHGASGTGTVTIDLNGETGKVDFGGVKFDLPDKGEIILADNPPIYNAATGVTITLEKAVFDEATQKWDVSYSYNFDTAKDHTETEGYAEKSGADDILSGSIPITVTDESLGTASGSLTIEVHDDVPVISAVSSRAVKSSFGADDRAGEEGSQQQVVVRFGDAPEALRWSHEGTEDTDISQMQAGQTWTTTLQVPGIGENGEPAMTSVDINVIYDATSGRHVFTYADTEAPTPDLKLDVEITDADGDTASTTLNLADHGVTVTPGNAVPGASNVAMVYDAGLEGGNHYNVEEGKNEDGYPTKVEQSMLIEAKDGLQSIKIGWDGADGSKPDSITVSPTETGELNEVIKTADGTLTITGCKWDADTESYKLDYTYELTKAADHGEPGEPNNNRLPHNFKVTVTDLDGDVGEGTLRVNVVDDAPVWTSESYTVNNNAGFTSIRSDTAIDFVHADNEGNNGVVGYNSGAFNQIDLGTNLVFKTAADGHPIGSYPQYAPGNPVVQAKTSTGSVEITASFVHYRYVMPEDDAEPGASGHLLKVDNVVDINNAIANSAKALYLTGDGITVGATTLPNAWNGGATPGEITAGSANDQKLLNYGGKTNFDNAYPGKIGYIDGAKTQVDGDNISEAIIFDLKGGDTSYGFKINLGGMDPGDRVLLTFMQTPPDSSDDSIVKMVTIGTDGEGSAFYDKVGDDYIINVQDGFTKVIVSALPKENYTVGHDGFSADRDTEGETTDEEAQASGFIIKSVDFLKPSAVSSGDVKATSADNPDMDVTYTWHWANLEGADVLVKGEGGGEFTLHFEKEGDSQTFACTAVKPDTTEDGTAPGLPLFKAELDTQTGHWTVQYNREFEMVDGGKFTVSIDATDKDGDVSTIDLDLNPVFPRFNDNLEGFYLGGEDGWGKQDVIKKDIADDILVGNADNSLIYGKGGDDLLIGDKLETEARTDRADRNEQWAQGGLDAEAYATVKTLATNIIDRSSGFVNDDTNRDWFNLNGVDKAGNQKNTSTAVDQFYDRINGLTTDDQREALGRELELHERVNHGDDALYGGRGNDLLFGAGGNDYLDGGDGSDIIYGGGGNDIILYDKGDAYIDGGSNIDILLVGKGVEFKDVEDNADSIRNIEVIIRSDDTTNLGALGITSLKSLAERGVTIDEAHNAIYLSSAWTKVNEEGEYKNTSDGLSLKADPGKVNIGVVDVRASDQKTGSAVNDVLLDSAAVGVIGAGLTAATFDDVFKQHEDLAQKIAQPENPSGSEKDTVAHIFAGGGDDIIFSNAKSGFLLGDGDAETMDKIASVLNTESVPGTGEDSVDARVAHLEAIDSQLQKMETGQEQEPGLETATDGADIIHGGAGSEILYGGGKDDLLDGGAGDDTLIGGSGDDVLLGGAGEDLLFGGSGNDYLDGGTGKDSLFADAGDDLIVYDPTDYLIDGGQGIDFLLSGSEEPAHSLADMLGNWEARGATENMPMVHDVEVMLKGVDTSLQNMDALAKEYGFSMEKDANGRETLVLDKGKWELDEAQSGNGTQTYVNAESGVTLETTLAEVGTTGTDAGEQAAQTIVLANNG